MGTRSKPAIRIAALLALAASAQAAEARRGGFFFFGGSGETIDLVRDLPDTEAFKRDGDYYDLGFLYKRKSAYGVTVSSDKEHGSYVLYHGDSYIKLDASGLALLRGALGYDPLQRNVTPAAATSAPSVSSSGSGSMIPRLLFVLIVVGVGFTIVRRMAKRGAALVSPVVAPAVVPDEAPDPHLGFEAKVAARLAELRAGDPALTTAPAPAPAQSATPVRTFGRRGT